MEENKVKTKNPTTYEEDTNPNKDDRESSYFKRHYWKCRWCNGAIHKNGTPGVDYVQFPKGWYYHPVCYELKMDPQKPHPLWTSDNREEYAVYVEAMYRFIQKKFGKDMNMALALRQFGMIYNRHKDDGWTYENMYKAFRYFYEEKKGDWKKSNGGCWAIELCYNEAMDFYARLEKEREAIAQSISKESPKSKMIIIPRIEKKRKKETYNIEEW